MPYGAFRKIRLPLLAFLCLAKPERAGADPIGGEGPGPGVIKPVVVTDKPPSFGKVPGKDPVKDPVKDPIKDPVMQPSKPFVKGPLSKKALYSLKESEEKIKRAENDMRGTAGGNLGLCAAGDCAAIANLTGSILQAAAALSALGAERQRQAQAAQDQLLAGIYAGPGTKADVAGLSRLFEKGRRPDDSEIGGLAPSLQDPAHALRTNQDEIYMLRQVERDYAQVTKDAGNAHRKVQAIQKRGESLQEMAARRGAPRPAVGAAGDFGQYPRALGSAGGEKQVASEISSAGDAELPPASAAGGPLRAPTGPQAGKQEEKKGDAAKDAKVAAEREEKKNLNKEGTTLLASIMSELQEDLNGSLKAGQGAKSLAEALDAEAGPENRGGSGQPLRPGAVAGSTGVPEPGAPASQFQAALSSPETSLFQRVRSCLRRQSASQSF